MFHFEKSSTRSTFRLICGIKFLSTETEVPKLPRILWQIFRKIKIKNVSEARLNILFPTCSFHLLSKICLFWLFFIFIFFLWLCMSLSNDIKRIKNLTTAFISGFKIRRFSNLLLCQPSSISNCPLLQEVSHFFLDMRKLFHTLRFKDSNNHMKTKLINSKHLKNKIVCWSKLDNSSPIGFWDLQQTEMKTILVSVAQLWIIKFLEN